MNGFDNRAILPVDGFNGALAGRIWRPGIGPAIVAIREEGAIDVSTTFSTMSSLCALDKPAEALRAATGENIGSIDALSENTDPENRNQLKPWLLAPIDLQVIKAAGVTFAKSMLERVIGEKSNGHAANASSIREEVQMLLGGDFKNLRPGSAKALQLKEFLLSKGAWSQYLEVGLGPDAEIFTKAPCLSAVGSFMNAGLNAKSTWNNPEPEAVIVVSAAGKAVGATLGNDVNLRDFEGRSALLLSKAKDNNASCSIGPFIRFFDHDFTLDDVRNMSISLTIKGEDGFELEDISSMSEISRDLDDLISQTIGCDHQYPDGLVLFTGTMFAPTKDRDAPGMGFTHTMGDIVSISSSKLGTLTNRMRASSECEPWTFGISALMRNLAGRRLLLPNGLVN